METLSLGCMQACLTSDQVYSLVASVGLYARVTESIGSTSIKVRPGNSSARTETFRGPSPCRLQLIILYRSALCTAVVSQKKRFL